MIGLLFTLLVDAALVSSLNNGIGKLPTLGWNSWNAFECSITESRILSAAQQLIDLGLKVSVIMRIIPLLLSRHFNFRKGCWIYIHQH